MTYYKNQQGTTAPIPNAVSVGLKQLPASIKSAGGGTDSGFKSAQGIAAGRYLQA